MSFAKGGELKRRISKEVLVSLLEENVINTEQ
jgi:hypothetical protein